MIVSEPLFDMGDVDDVGFVSDSTGCADRVRLVMMIRDPYIANADKISNGSENFCIRLI